MRNDHVSGFEHAPVTSPGEALRLLKAGNHRFSSGNRLNPRQDLEYQKKLFAQGQNPFATIVACSDSRLPVEILFDLGLGDLFVVRVGGNIIGPSELGTVEFGVETFDTHLCVILGHTNCAAVSAAVDNLPMSKNVFQLIQSITVPVKRLRETREGVSRDELMDLAVTENVLHQMSILLEQSEVVRNSVRKGTTQLLGAVYDLATGRVDWLGEHPDENSYLEV